MRGTVAAQSRVVIGRYGVDKTFVRLGVEFGESEAFVDDCLYVREVMSLVKVFISGNDFCFDVADKCLGYHVSIFLLENTKLVIYMDSAITRIADNITSTTDLR